MAKVPEMTIEDYHEALFAEQSRRIELETEIEVLKKDRRELSAALLDAVEWDEQPDKTLMSCAGVWASEAE